MDEPIRPYEYKDLGPGEIRLLRPDTHYGSAAWTLDIVSLGSAVLDFDALSYTWGSQLETYPIVCNRKSMRVHHNLYSALPFLAQRSGQLAHRPIWVDAVCINQNDDDEKGVQIKLMSQLYRRAKRVWVWLGCARAEVQSHMARAISLLPYFVEEARRRKAWKYISREEDVSLPLMGLEPEIWEAILHLLRNPWYSRVWIVQEAALASDVGFICGAHEIDAALLESAVDCDTPGSWRVFDINGNRMKLGFSMKNMSTVFLIRDLVQAGRESLSLNTTSALLRITLLMTGEQVCFMPQDRVYGMLGLIGSEELDSQVKFDAEMSVSTLYTQLATYLLLNSNPNETQFWWPLFNLAFSFQKSRGLPSWVPDFHRQGMSSKYVCETATIAMFPHDRAEYCAGGQSTVVTAGPHMGEIMIRGKLVDEILLTHPPGVRSLKKNPEGGESTRWIITVAEWHEEIARRVLKKLDHQENGRDETGTEYWRVSEETYWKALFADNFLDETNKPITKKMCRAFRSNILHAAETCHWILESIGR